MMTHKDALKEAIERRADLASAEQFCTDCNRWTTVPLQEVQGMLADCAAPRTPGAFGVRMRFFNCQHCSASQIVLQPGKYDPLHARVCTMQRYTFRKG
jgi:hypothetical protein